MQEHCIELRGGRSGINYRLNVPPDLYRQLVGGADGPVSFQLGIERDLMYVQKRYEELVVSPDAKIRLVEVEIQAEVPLPGPVPRGTALSIRAQRRRK